MLLPFDTVILISRNLPWIYINYEQALLVLTKDWNQPKWINWKTFISVYQTNPISGKTQPPCVLFCSWILEVGNPDEVLQDGWSLLHEGSASAGRPKWVEVSGCWGEARGGLREVGMESSGGFISVTWAGMTQGWAWAGLLTGTPTRDLSMWLRLPPNLAAGF